MSPQSDDPDPLTDLLPMDPAGPTRPENQPQPTDTPNAVGDLTVGAIEVTGQVVSAAVEAGGTLAETAGSLAEGAGTVAGAAAEGCSGCSCVIVVAIGLAPSAGSAIASQLLQ